MQKRVILSDGTLNTCFEKVRRNFYERISPQKHAETYHTAEGLHYAEPEFTGKYLDMCAYYYQSENNKKALDNGMTVVNAIKNYQRQDGYLGCLESGNELKAFSVWNHSFTLYGLARMYEATKNEEIKNIADKAAQWLLDVYADCSDPCILDATNNGSENITCIFSIMYMYKVTGDTKYSDFVKKVLNYCENTAMNLLTFKSILKLQSAKGIEMLVVYLGVLCYGKMLNDQRAVDAAKRYWQEINDTQIRNTGNATIKEVWTEDGNAPQLLPTDTKPNETCVAVGWIELSLSLFYSEQKAKYLDAVEKSLFNHMIGSLDKNGEDFAYYQGNYGKKIYRTDDGAYQCCRYRGFTIFSYLKEYLYYVNETAVIPMVYTPSVLETDEIKLTQQTDYPKSGNISFKAECKTEKELKIRVPAWCKQYSLSVNGKQINAELRDGFVAVKLPAGDTEVLLCLDMAFVKTESIIEGTNYLSYNYGPLLLTLDTHFGNSIDDCADENGNITKLEVKNGDSLVHFKVGNIHLIDFASAGSIEPDKDVYSVFIKKKG